MSYAIIQTGGKQYKVKAGEILKIERLEDSKLEAKRATSKYKGLLWA